MLVTLDAIYNRVIQNQKRGKRTWIIADEFYILFRYEYSANFFYKLWKRIRKYNGLITGLTQNVDELLRSDTARLMLANSEFLILLKPERHRPGGTGQAAAHLGHPAWLHHRCPRRLRPDPMRWAAGAVHQCVPGQYRPLSSDEYPAG